MALKKEQVLKCTLKELTQMLSDAKEAVRRRFLAFRISQMHLADLDKAATAFEENGNETPLKEAIGLFLYRLERSQESYVLGMPLYLDQRFRTMQNQIANEESIKQIDNDLGSRFAKVCKELIEHTAPKTGFDLDRSGELYNKALTMIEQIATEQRQRCAKRRQRAEEDQKRRDAERAQREATHAQQQREAEMTRRKDVGRSLRIAAGLCEPEPNAAQSILPVIHTS